jgi:galactokinase
LKLPSLKTFFGPRRRIVSASAPGRLDVMGGIADYSGSLVMEMPIRERIHVYAAKREDCVWRVLSRETGLLEAETRDLSEAARARAFLNRNPKTSWGAYILGCVPFLIEKGIACGGADMYVRSDVPMAKGLSSSAALEVATMTALGKLFGIRFSETELPVLCQKVENLVVGAPCGLMDQLTCYLGRKNRLLPILCQPHLVSSPVAVPKGVFFAGLDSGVRHWVGNSSYSDVRTAAFMGYSLIAMKEGAKRADLQRAREKKDASALPYQGYLARVFAPLIKSRYATLLPRRMKGRDFLRKAVSIDPITLVKPDALYRVRSCAEHPVYENFRVFLFKNLLEILSRTRDPGKKRKILSWMGNLMYESHSSYSACGLGEPTTDAIVEGARQAGPAKGVYGAKITGGGSGGTVCLLVEGRKGLSEVRRIAACVLKGRKPFIALGSSDGARWTIK